MEGQIAALGRPEKSGKVPLGGRPLAANLRGEKNVLPLPKQKDFEGLLVAVAKAQDKGAFAALYGHFAPRVKTYLMGFKIGERAAEDLVQEVFLTLWRKAPQFDPGKAKASTWIFTIARNRLIDEKRKEKRFPADALKFESETVGLETGETKLAEKETKGAVQKALQGLPEDQRQILELAFLKGLTHAEIAEESGLALGTVKSRIRLAFSKMRHQLEKQK